MEIGAISREEALALMVIRQRRAAALKETGEAVQEVAGDSALSDFDRMRDKVERLEGPGGQPGPGKLRGRRISAAQKAAQQQSVDEELARLKEELKKTN
jgi:phage shock protein A